MAAANAFNPVHHHSLRRRHHDCPPIAAATSLSLKPSSTASRRALFTHSSSSFSAAAPSTSAAAEASASDVVSFDLLRQHLSSENFRQADEETRRLLIALAGDAAQKRGYVFFSEVQFIPAGDLRAVDDLWRDHSGGRYGYSVQKRIWEKSKRDFTKFFIKVGWMKKLEGSEVEQYNYRSFPAEFVWEASPPAPEGHLPLTNALRGTQLLSSILSHPAFEEEEEDEVGEEAMAIGEDDNGEKAAVVGPKGFKPNYTF
ncbi:tetrapyrrole-binding protein, chloroplastic [Andrographis paniculata]|uniref:tetrapyrrole-binding protein, chloroplastic n=1 Tax=Andrographis paniculata TaxID=175694 RepID=UPI0021E70163|nr:tetrapyrrole-binding protein, chloroplastic [Andrographis paniculata]